MKSIYNFVNEKLTLNKQSSIYIKDLNIEDAEDGDIITAIDNEDRKYIYIFKCINQDRDLNNIPVIRVYAYYDCRAEYFTVVSKDYYLFTLREFKSKSIKMNYLSPDEDQQIFFDAMKERDYKWDHIKKEIIRI